MPRCPSCSTLMTRVERDNIRVSTCSGCFGDWIQRQALLHVVRLPVEVKETDPTLGDLAAVVVESNTKKTLKCPECHRDLRKERLHQMVPVQIDRCNKCEGVWLDVGKLPLLQRLYQELQTSTDPAVIAMREKIAGVNLLVEQDRERKAEQVHPIHKGVPHTGSSLGNTLMLLADFYGLR